MGSGKTWALGAGGSLLFQERSWASLPDALELQLSSRNPVLPNRVSQGGDWSKEGWPGSKGERSKAMPGLTFGEEAGVGP